MQKNQPGAGFSLVEVVLAIGIVSFALLAIFGLFGNALQSKAETLSQQEVLGLTRSLPEFLGNPQVSSGFAEVYEWARQPAGAPEIFAFMDSGGSFRIGRADDTSFVQEAENRSGRLFRIVPALSPNMPLRDANGEWIPRPGPENLPASHTSFTNHAALPLQVQVFEVGAMGISTTNRMPVLIYDTALRRF
jgi:hypothetical protein